MPVYAYSCAECGSAFERLRGISQSDGELECPSCGETGKAKRRISTFASFTKTNGVSRPTNYEAPSAGTAPRACGPGCGCHGGII
jgi:putative FmdB family regulatory protein